MRYRALSTASAQFLAGAAARRVSSSGCLGRKAAWSASTSARRRRSSVARCAIMPRWLSRFVGFIGHTLYLALTAYETFRRFDARLGVFASASRLSLRCFLGVCGMPVYVILFAERSSRILTAVAPLNSMLDNLVPISRSMLRKCTFSSALQRLIATPAAPAL